MRAVAFAKAGSFFQHSQVGYVKDRQKGSHIVLRQLITKEARLSYSQTQSLPLQLLAGASGHPSAFCHTCACL
jgi:hypothetical protein